MTLTQLLESVTNKSNFTELRGYITFCQRYLDFIATELQATIIAQNEHNYCFFQYRQEGHFNITRPINANLMYTSEQAAFIAEPFIETLLHAHELEINDPRRALIRNSIYTIQQSIGATLDALPAGQVNTARKINGDLFERLISLLLQTLGIDCRSGVINVPIIAEGAPQFTMSYQHDLLLYRDDVLKVIGSVKTSSKDRLDKIFIDKFLYARLTETDTPHIAIFLNDVQRKRAREINRYGVSTTFLPGHFKGYTVKLNPLDGVYYCDIRPTMETDDFLRTHIKTIDSLFCEDILAFMQAAG